MCILFVYANGRPLSGTYKLIVASNRDWFYSRPSMPAHQWKEFPHVFGGVDMEAGREGGTWLAVSGKDKIIKFGAMLSLAGESSRESGKSGRGFIVKNYVTGNLHNSEYCDSLKPNHSSVSAFNFVSVEIFNNIASIIYSSNSPPSKEQYTENLCYGFSNSSPECPFEKVKYCQEKFSKIVAAGVCSKKLTKFEIVDKCMEFLKDRTMCWPDEELNRRVPMWAKYQCSPFVENLEIGAGTRARTVILVDDKDKMNFVEEAMTTTNPNDDWKLTFIEHEFT